MTPRGRHASELAPRAAPPARRARRTVGWIVLALVLFAALIVIVSASIEPRPPRLADRSGPAFEVRVVKPLASRPLFGLIPIDDPSIDHASPGAEVVRAAPDRLELRADGWELLVEVDAEGRIGPATRLVFTLELGGKVRTLCCRPTDPPAGHLRTTTDDAAGTIGGTFLVKLARCEIAATGKAIEWPPAPLTVVGGFERLPLAPGAAPAETR